MSANKKNKLTNYILKDNKLGQESAVSDILGLFGLKAIQYASTLFNQEIDTMPVDTMVIKHYIEKSALLLEIVYRDGTSLKPIVIKQAISMNENQMSDKKEINRLIKVNLFKHMKDITGYAPGPWGILKGVKPTKLVHRFIDEGMSGAAIVKHLMDHYSVSNEKAWLLEDIARHQREFLPTIQNPQKNIVSIYIGIPFCPSKCLYCSFPSYVIPESHEIIDSFISALSRDIDEIAKLVDRYGLLVQNVYVGGGTPTSLKGKYFDWLLDTVSKAFITDFTREFTVEAGRPDSIDNEHIASMRRYKVSRVSINPQTMQTRTLNLIGRKHTVQDIIDVFYMMKKADIPVINMDIIAGLPGETAKDMENTMQQLQKLNPDNLTVHTLAIKKGSSLKENLMDYPLPSALETREMLLIAANYAHKLDMKPYYLYRQKYMTGNMENIGYSKINLECLYNIQVLEERQTIIGIGPAAATKAVNTANWHLDSFYYPKDVKTYIANLDRYLTRRSQILSELFCDIKED